jgi:hypothetical protein
VIGMSADQEITRREQAMMEMAGRLWFTVEKRGSLYSFYRDVDVAEPVRREGLTLEAAEDLMTTWKMHGFHGG